MCVKIFGIFSIKKMKESGRLDRMWKIYGKSLQKDCQSVSDDQKPLAMKDVFMAFVLLGSAAIVALVLLKLEKLQKKERGVSNIYRKRTHRKKRCTVCNHVIEKYSNLV